MAHSKELDSVSPRLRFTKALAFAFVMLTAALLSAQETRAIPASTNKLVVGDSKSGSANNVVIELFYRSDSEQSLEANRYLLQLAAQRKGIRVKTHDILKDAYQLKRLWQLSKRFRYEKAGVPTFYLCDSLKVGFAGEKKSGPQIEQLLTIRAYVRPGCKRCKAGKEFLNNLSLKWPGLRVEYHNVIADPYARTEVQKLADRHRVRVASFPCIQVAGRFVVGYQSDEITGRKIESFFQDRSVETPELPKQSTRPKIESDKDSASGESKAARVYAATSLALLGYLQSESGSGNQNETTELPIAVPTEVPIPDEATVPNDLPAEASVPSEDAGFRLPSDVSSDAADDEAIIVDSTSDEIEVPWLGRLSVSNLGLPTFTFLIGLVDGFNPCAMWVLVFLLSVLVNIKDRKKILVVAGTFVVVSGLAYFAFMAAWFSVFHLIGYLRPVQIGLGMMAIVIGLVNVKDFFYFGRGISFSIPESAKPGIYRRVREIVSANYLSTALFGAIVLAVLVNFVELLCTAGLPALYTEILSLQNLPTWKNYAYLGLYITAYMLDDAVLVAIIVTTMSRRRLQESEGRWLKLLSGIVILLLGGVMIFRPSLLV